MEFLESLAPLAGNYDLFIIDLWGVIHDGRALYPTSKDCLENLRQQKKSIIFLSNAPRRCGTVADTLTKMGITGDLYDRIVTSGEAFFQSLAHPDRDFFYPMGRNYLYMGLERDRGIIDELPYEETKNPDAASFLLLSHSYYDNQPMAELMPLLERCLARKLPALCINPDKEIVRLDGTHVMCAGVIAEQYHKMGGEVLYFGKPHRKVYDACMKGHETIGQKRILAIGDSLANDIAGARANGIDSVLVTGGILHKAAGGAPEAVREKLAAMMQVANTQPDFVIPAFQWR